ncbi:MAG: hypothetical protein K9G42_12215, partial [Pedobacter sp.]|nr:hypothetical protein [Pedobacter sp.]
SRRSKCHGASGLSALWAAYAFTAFIVLFEKIKLIKICLIVCKIQVTEGNIYRHFEEGPPDRTGRYDREICE